MRERLLARHFLGRFLDNDLVSPNADRHESVSMVAAALISSGLFLAVMLSLKYLFTPFQSPAMTAILSLDDIFFYSTASMSVMALVAVAEWNALSLDARDGAILGPLPVPLAAVVRAKIAAVGLLAVTFALAFNLAPSIVHPVLMVANLRIGL